MSSASTTGAVYDLDQGGANLTVSNCAYSPLKTTGALTVANTPATLAPAQGFNNTGQTTPLPSTSAFTGPHAVTLLFHDSAGGPVSNVVFTITGVGVAVSDSSGLRTLAMEAGTYTILALATSGTLWPSTSITVTADATFTLTGTAVTVPAPASPSQTTAYLTTRDGQGNTLRNVLLSFQLIDPQRATDTFDQAAFTVTSDSAGSLQVPLLKSTQYQARVGNGPWVSFTTGSDSTFALPEILGTYST